MSPAGLLLLALALTGVAWLVDRALQRRRRRVLRALASSWRMHYSPSDSLRLLPKVTPNFPFPGAARLRVFDLIYGRDQQTYRYIFSCQYTAGVVRGKKRIVRAATFTEARTGGGEAPQITLAPAHLPLIEQYRRLAPPAAEPLPSSATV